MKRNRHLEFSEISDVTMDDMREILKVSQADMQSLKRQALLVAAKVLVGLV
jgi:hypothetical protein